MVKYNKDIFSPNEPVLAVCKDNFSIKCLLFYSCRMMNKYEDKNNITTFS